MTLKENRTAQSVKLVNVSYSYPVPTHHHSVLKDINLEIYQGEWLTIVGSNGSGKSTLAKIMAGLLKLKQGNVEGLTELGPVHMVMQNPDAQIIGETVYEDLCFGMENHQIPSTEMLQRAKQSSSAGGTSGFLGLFNNAIIWWSKTASCYSKLLDHTSRCVDHG